MFFILHTILLFLIIVVLGLTVYYIARKSQVETDEHLKRFDIMEQKLDEGNKKLQEHLSNGTADLDKHKDYINTTINKLTVDIKSIKYDLGNNRKYKCDFADCIGKELSPYDLIQYLKHFKSAFFVEASTSTSSMNGVGKWGAQYFICFGELFYRLVQITNTGEIYFNLQLYGLDELAVFYGYEIVLQDPKNTTNKLYLTGKCSKYQSYENKIMVDSNRAKSFVQNNKVTFETKIIKL